MAARSELRKLLEAVGKVLGRERLNDLAEAAGTERRARMENAIAEVCARYAYVLEYYLDKGHPDVLSRNEWNDVAEYFGLPRRKSYDDIFDQFIEEL